MTSNWLKQLGSVLSACCLLVLAGCDTGQFRFASVSGVVMLDGEPLPDASIRFQPQRQGDSPLVGPTSYAVTNSEGRYKLKTYEGRSGAVVGPHIVSVSTYEERLVDPAKPEQVQVVSQERVPVRYRSPSELEFEVPSGGASDANFDLLRN